MVRWIDLFIVLPFRSAVERKRIRHAAFAEHMFNDLSFPKDETAFDPLSRYIEEKADPYMPSIVFDELYQIV